jgi:hypothetical protein
MVMNGNGAKPYAEMTGRELVERVEADMARERLEEERAHRRYLKINWPS